MPAQRLHSAHLTSALAGAVAGAVAVGDDAVGSTALAAFDRSRCASGQGRAWPSRGRGAAAGLGVVLAAGHRSPLCSATTASGAVGWLHAQVEHFAQARLRLVVDDAGGLLGERIPRGVNELAAIGRFAAENSRCVSLPLVVVFISSCESHVSSGRSRVTSSMICTVPGYAYFLVST